MGQLIVRNLDDELIRALKVRAAQHGRSMEAEHREILRATLAAEADDPETSFKAFLLSMPDVGTDEDFHIPRDLPRDLPSDLE